MIDLHRFFEGAGERRRIAPPRKLPAQIPTLTGAGERQHVVVVCIELGGQGNHLLAHRGLRATRYGRRPVKAERRASALAIAAATEGGSGDSAATFSFAAIRSCAQPLTCRKESGELSLRIALGGEKQGECSTLTTPGCVLSCPRVMKFEAKGLAKAFAGPPIFRDVSLASERGLVAVTGRNGSGKSTLLKIFAGLMRPSRGSVALWNDGRRLLEAEHRHAIGFASPELEFPDELTAVENLGLLARSAGRPVTIHEIESRLDDLGLVASARNRRAGEFSSGMKQRVRLAFSLLLDPPVLLWDEPFSNLDGNGIEAAGRIMNQRRESGLVILATNDRRDIEDADSEVTLS